MAVNEFLPFATMATANVVAQADYALDPTTGNGFTAGIALSAKLNKVWRQAAFVGAGLAQFMMERTNADVVDDGDLDKFVQQLYDSFVVTLTGTGDTRWVNITGDTMTGPLVLAADPVQPLEPATKQYVDNGFTYIGGILQAGYLPLAGGVMTGPITLNANPTQPLQPATKAYVDQVFGGSGSALDPRYVNVAGDTMQGALHVLEPVAASNAATKFYVDDRDRIHTEYDNWYADNAVLNLRTYVDGQDQAIISWVSASFMPISGGGAMTEAAADARYVNITGDTMSGALSATGYYLQGMPFGGYDDRQIALFGRAGNVSLGMFGAADNYLNYHAANRHIFIDVGGGWYAQFLPGEVHFNSTTWVYGNLNPSGDLNVGNHLGVANGASISGATGFGNGVYIGGTYPGYAWTLAVGGQLEVSTNCYVYGAFTAVSAAISGMLTCSSFDVTGNDSKISGNLYVGNICTVANAVSAPTLLASYELWVGTKINTTQYLLNGLAFASHSGSVLFIQDPGGHSVFVCYGGNSTNYYSNAQHAFSDYTIQNTFAIFNYSACYNVAGQWYPLSNRELKRDIADYDRGLEALRKLRPVSFVYNENMPLGDDQGRTRYGLIAEDVEEIIPEMTQADTINGQDIMAVAPGHLVFVLTNAVKELADRLDGLERRLNDDARTTQRTERPRSGK